jgi:hypothetical protein
LRRNARQSPGSPAQEGFRIVESFAEAETGKGADALGRRPKLAAALKAARRIDNGCPASSQSLIACRTTCISFPV